MAPDTGPSGSSREAPVTAQPEPSRPPRGQSRPAERGDPAGKVVTGMIHHIELWVPDLDRAIASWGWLLDELGYKPFGDWPGGRSWRAGITYIVLEQSPDRTASRHDRCRPGLNHLAFHVADQEQVEKLVAVAPSNGWRRCSPTATRMRGARALRRLPGERRRLRGRARRPEPGHAGRRRTDPAAQPSLTGADSRRSRDDRPTCTVNCPGDHTQPSVSASHRANALAGTRSGTSADAPGGAVTAVKAASSRGGVAPAHLPVPLHSPAPAARPGRPGRPRVPAS